MKLPDFKFLCDENIDPTVTSYLISLGYDATSVREAGLSGAADHELLEFCVAQKHVIVTHDSDFGTLAFASGAAFVGIVFLRPGHIDPQFTVGSVDALLKENPELQTPSIIAVRRNGIDVTIRVRSNC